MWMVRAEIGNRLFHPFIDKGVVAIGWPDVGDLSQYSSREAILGEVRRVWPDWKPQKHNTAAGMLYRFAYEMKPGDRVVTYNQQQRVYAVGRLKGPYRHDPSFDSHDPNVRSVCWETTALSRDLFSAQTKNTLGSVLTLFQLSSEAERDVERVIAGQPPAVTDPVAAEEAESDLLQDIEARSIEFIKDRLVRLDWSDMQDVVAGLLRAMGYKTRVSPAGPDRGKDIIASPDGFGFEDPRIVVEVKHRSDTAIGSQAIRSFLGGRHPGDKGLFVSTGGFSKDALYEAERANIPVTLMDLDSLVGTLLENYAVMDPETQRLLPLKRIFWPLA